MITPPKPEARNRLIAAVHAAAKGAGLDEDARRDLMAVAVGKRSASDCTNYELGKVLDAINGIQRRDKKRFKASESPLVRKIWAMWKDLKKQGLVNVDTPHGFAKRITNTDRIEWSTPENLMKVVEALKSLKRRADKK